MNYEPFKWIVGLSESLEDSAGRECRKILSSLFLPETLSNLINDILDFHGHAPADIQLNRRAVNVHGIAGHSSSISRTTGKSDLVNLISPTLPLLK
jgi:hypothetical protein